MNAATLHLEEKGFEGLDQPYYPPLTKALFTGVLPCIPQPQSPFFVKFPREIRERVYQYIFKHHPPSTLFHKSDGTGGVETRVDEVPVSVMFACKQMFVETWPALTSHLELFMTYRQSEPCVPVFMPPTRVCCNIRKMVLLDASDEWEGYLEEMPDFSKFPALQVFVIRREIPIHIQQTESEWHALTPDRKVSMFRDKGSFNPKKIIVDVQATNEDNWLSKLVVEGRKYDGIWIMGKDVWWDHRKDELEEDCPWPQTAEEEAAEETRKAAAAIVAEKYGRAVMSRMKTLVETDYQVGRRAPSGYHYTFDVITVVLDVDTGLVTESRLLTKEEVERHQFETAQPS